MATVLLLAAALTIWSSDAAAQRRGAPALTAMAPAPVECAVPGTRQTIDQLWHPDMRAAVAYAHRRVGDIAFAVRTDGRFYGYRPGHVEWSASVVKAMLMVAYLDRPSVAHRQLNSSDKSLLSPMITASDNGAADQVDEIVGNRGLDALARRVGMTRFEAVAPIWGETHITARDQTRFFLHVDRYVVARHRRYAMRLLASIIPSERWGIGELPQRGWTEYFKGGWGYGTGLLDHQVVLLKRGCARVAIAVLTMYDGSHAYGKQTLRGIFARLLRHFPQMNRHPKSTPHARASPPPTSTSLAVPAPFSRRARAGAPRAHRRRRDLGTTRNGDLTPRAPRFGSGRTAHRCGVLTSVGPSWTW